MLEIRELSKSYRGRPVVRNVSMQVQRGKVVAARIDGPEPVGDSQAVFQMLTWRRGRFSFSYLDVEMDDQVRTSTTHLLLEGARLIDERARG